MLRLLRTMKGEGANDSECRVRGGMAIGMVGAHTWKVSV